MRITVANAAAAPQVVLDATAVTLDFAVGSVDAPTQITIENLQASDIGLNGLIDNPIGYTRIVSGGNIVNGSAVLAAGGVAGMVRSNAVEMVAGAGSIGLAANDRIRVEVVQAAGLDTMLTASASGDIHLDLTARLRDVDAANNRFGIDALDAGGDVDLLLRTTLHETTVSGTRADLRVNVVQEDLLAGYTHHFRPDTGPAGALPLDLRVFAITAQAADDRRRLRFRGHHGRQRHPCRRGEPPADRPPDRCHRPHRRGTVRRPARVDQWRHHDHRNRR